MAQQSSAMVMFRALVMMVCLIAIPLAALFGTSLPDAFKAIKEGRWPTLAGAAHASPPTQTALDEPAKFEPAGQPVPARAATLFSRSTNGAEPARATPLPSDPPQLATHWPGDTAAAGSAVVPAGYVAAADSPSRAANPAAVSPLPARPAADGQPAADLIPSAVPPNMANMVPLDALAEARTTAGSAGATAAAGRSPEASATADPFSYTQDRLRKMGATYYLLESWGGQQRLYRFYCKMAVGGNPNYTRYFEAIEPDPLRAMSQVLQQVENWRLGRL